MYSDCNNSIYGNLLYNSEYTIVNNDSPALSKCSSSNTTIIKPIIVVGYASIGKKISDLPAHFNKYDLCPEDCSESHTHVSIQDFEKTLYFHYNIDKFIPFVFDSDDDCVCSLFELGENKYGLENAEFLKDRFDIPIGPPAVDLNLVAYYNMLNDTDNKNITKYYTKIEKVGTYIINMQLCFEIPIDNMEQKADLVDNEGCSNIVVGDKIPFNISTPIRYISETYTIVVRLYIIDKYDNKKDFYSERFEIGGMTRSYTVSTFLHFNNEGKSKVYICANLLRTSVLFKYDEELNRYEDNNTGGSYEFDGQMPKNKTPFLDASKITNEFTPTGQASGYTCKPATKIYINREFSKLEITQIN